MESLLPGASLVSLLTPSTTHRAGAEPDRAGQMSEMSGVGQHGAERKTSKSRRRSSTLVLPLAVAQPAADPSIR
jgi:hypothetical protein